MTSSGEHATFAPSTPPPNDLQNGDDKPHPSPRNSKGWDGKLRIDKKPVVLSNPEAISDPEYSDDENVLEGEIIDADESRCCQVHVPLFG